MSLTKVYLTKCAAALALLALSSAPALAQTQDEVKKKPVEHSEMDHSKMEHADMDHGMSDHANMDHSAHDMADMKPMDTIAPLATEAPRITAKVNGLVCDFCAQALTKVFKKEEAVEGLNVDLDAGEVVIILKADGELEDARVKKLIRKSGYSLVSISRSGGA